MQQALFVFRQAGQARLNGQANTLGEFQLGYIGRGNLVDCAHSGIPVVRWLFAGNIALQRLTTRVPDDEQIQVAIASLERVRAEEDAIPSGL